MDPPYSKKWILQFLDKSKKRVDHLRKKAREDVINKYNISNTEQQMMVYSLSDEKLQEFVRVQEEDVATFSERTGIDTSGWDFLAFHTMNQAVKFDESEGLDVAFFAHLDPVDKLKASMTQTELDADEMLSYLIRNEAFGTPATFRLAFNIILGHVRTLSERVFRVALKQGYKDMVVEYVPPNVITEVDQFELPLNRKERALLDTRKYHLHEAAAGLMQVKESQRARVIDLARREREMEESFQPTTLFRTKTGWVKRGREKEKKDDDGTKIKRARKPESPESLKCEVCNVETTKRCGRCIQMAYCSKKCMVADWQKTHWKICV
jgi:hypothetical protein